MEIFSFLSILNFQTAKKKKEKKNFPLSENKTEEIEKKLNQISNCLIRMLLQTSYLTIHICNWACFFFLFFTFSLPVQNAWISDERGNRFTHHLTASFLVLLLHWLFIYISLFIYHIAFCHNLYHLSLSVFGCVYPFIHIRIYICICTHIDVYLNVFIYT